MIMSINNMNQQEEIIAIKDMLSTLSILYAQQDPHNAFAIGRRLEGLLLSDKIILSPTFKALAVNLSQNLLGNLDVPLQGFSLKPHQ